MQGVVKDVSADLVARAHAAIGERFQTGVVILDRDLTVRWLSPSAPTVIDRVPGSSEGVGALELVHPDDAEMVLMVLATAMADPIEVLSSPTGATTIEFPIRIRASSGGWTDVIASGRVFDTAGHFVIILRPAHERMALDRVISLLGNGDQLEPTLSSLVDLARAQFGRNEACLVHDFSGEVSVIGCVDVIEGCDPAALLSDARQPDSADFVADDRWWQCKVRERNGASVSGVMVVRPPRVEGPTSYDIGVMERVTSLASIALEWARRERRLRSDADLDHLTGLLNRRAFERMIDSESVSTERLPLAVVFVDLDRFKAVNDQHGHRVGDEFALLVPSTTAQAAGRLVERIRAAVQLPIHTSVGHVEVGLSAGLAIASEPLSVTTLMSHSDTAMYDDKAARRQRTG